MNRRKNTILIAAAVLLLCGAVFVGGVAAGDETSHTHASGTPGADITWTAWDSTKDIEYQIKLPTTGGNYYLTHDVTLGSTWSVPGTTNLCLNGHVIKANGTGFSVITIPSGATLNLYDCDTTTKHYFKIHKEVNGVDTLLNSWEWDSTQTTKPATCIALGEIKSYDGADKGWAHKTNNVFDYDYVEVTGGCITGGSVSAVHFGGGVTVNPGGTFTLNGGNIVGNQVTGGDASSGGVYVRGNNTSPTNTMFTMTGGSIAGNYTGGVGGGGGVMIDYLSSFTMSNGKIVGNTAAQRGGGGVDAWSGTFEMTGGEIKGNKATQDGGGVAVNTGACTFTMSGTASITYNSASWGGGVYVDGDSSLHDDKFTMFGTASIANNHSTGDGGGGVVITGGGTFEMSNGTISGNTATINNGGGVYVNGGTFTMKNGSLIENNTATNFGGGVYVNGADSTFTMEGGEITGNTATNYGGGVYVSGTFTMEGGEITGNTAEDGGGVYHSFGTFNVSKAPVIKGNTGSDKTTASNVYLMDDNKLELVAPLTGGEIRITKVSDSTPSEPAKFGTTKLSPGSGEEHFVADGDTLLVGSIEIGTGTNKLVWKAGVIVTFDANGHGTAPAKQIVASGSPVTRPADPSAAGYTFGGWYKEPECTTAWVFETDTVTSNFTLYAKWTKNSSGSSTPQGSSTWISTIPSVPGDNTVATDVTYQYTGQKFIPVSAANLEQISAADPAAAAAVEMVLQTASAAGIPLTNSKGAKAIVNTAESVPGTQTETFSQVIEVTSADGSKVTSVPFKVRLSDLAAKSLTTDDVTLYHYLEVYGLWIPLETGLVSTDDVYAYYEAATDGASPFGVLLKKLDAPEVKPVTPSGPSAKTPAPFVGVLAGLGAAVAVFGLRRK